MFYLLDVSGHGVSAALHSVSVLNVLRHRALAGVDFSDPAQVLASLNNRFQMDSHHGLFFTMWYGVYRPSDRTLIYGTAGHHHAFLVPPARTSAQPLGMPAFMIGAIPDVEYRTEQIHVPPGSALYLFSDGAFEQIMDQGRRWTESDLVPTLLEPPATTTESERLYQAVKRAAGSAALEDDLSLVVLRFP
jgi:sigma-B regulation protein RsbU (phosphoserine phosphatase)